MKDPLDEEDKLLVDEDNDDDKLVFKFEGFSVEIGLGSFKITALTFQGSITYSHSPKI